MTRIRWPKPPLDVLVAFLRLEDRKTRRSRARRSQILLAEFGPPADMLLAGIPAMFAIHEMRSSFVNGNYMATVLVAQVFAEHSLAHPFVLMGDDAIATSGFAKLIDESRARDMITGDLHEALHRLRRMRNPYTHPNPGVTPRSFMGRMRDTGIWDPHRLARRDALDALQIVVDFLRHGSPDWKPHSDDPDPWWTANGIDESANASQVEEVDTQSVQRPDRADPQHGAV